MYADIITIGDELLIGQVVNSNAAWLGNQLNYIGIKVNRITSVGDLHNEIINILKEASSRSQVIIITGGLGPTSDDITKPALCEYFNTSLKFDDSVFKQIKTFVDKRGGTMNELNRNQAMVPSSATILQNKQGTAPGLWFEKDNIIYVSLPGVPFEMEELVKVYILPKLIEKFQLPSIYHKTILTTGIPELNLALLINDWEKQLPENIKLAYLPSPGIVKLRLTGIGDSTIIDSIKAEIIKLQSILKDLIFGFDDDTLEKLIGRLLSAKHKTVSTVESCTGGNIAKMITSVPGSSEYYVGSIVAYSNYIKINELDIPETLINQFGAVSKQVVESMATGAIKKLGSNYSIAISGIAGPTGGSDEKPIGTTWIAVASENTVISGKYIFGGTRERNITLASIKGLDMLRKLLLSNC